MVNDTQILPRKMSDAQYLALLARLGKVMTDALEAEGLTAGTFGMRVEIRRARDQGDGVTDMRTGPLVLTFNSAAFMGE